jgi:hypothetical protein
MMPGIMRLLGLIFGAAALHAQSTCGTVGLSLTSDYQYAIGTSNGGSAFAWTENGQTIAQGPMTQLDLFHFDSSLQSTSGISPAKAVGASFVPGKFGMALTMASAGILSYPAAGNVSVIDGTVEMWVTLKNDGSQTDFSQYTTLFLYTAANGDQIVLSSPAGGGGFYGASNTGKTSTGTGTGGSPVTNITAWHAGEWHHLALTYSSSQGPLTMYLDGQPVGQINKPIPMPAADGQFFTIGDSPFLIDEVRVSNDEKTQVEIQYDFSRSTAFGNDEVLLPLNGLPPGQLGYSVTAAGTPCGSATAGYQSAITNVNPPSGLLPPDSTGVTITFATPQPTTCRYSVGNDSPYNSMQPLDADPASIAHKAFIAGLSADPRVLNSVYVRCAQDPTNLQMLQYRSVSAPSGPFPRIGSLWRGYLYAADPTLAPKIQLYLGPGSVDPSKVRSTNPNALLLPSVSTISIDPSSEGGSVPDNYFLKDVNGNRILFCCEDYYLNLTIPEVATFVAQRAYNLLAQSNFEFDGIFFDTFSTGISYVTTDFYGNPVQLDANGDGKPDDPTTLNAAWSAGVYSVIQSFKQLAPYAYTSAHLPTGPPDPASLAVFNGDSVVFGTVNVLEGRSSFDDALNAYQDWFASGVPPPIAIVQSAPPTQISYGYGPVPMTGLLPSTVTFAQTFYPNMRFGLAMALMNDGFFSYDPGDNPPNLAWWYDEYDFNLGYPLGPEAEVGMDQSASLLSNGDFENGLASWKLLVDSSTPAKAAASTDSTIVAAGAAAARIAVSSAAQLWNVQFVQTNVALVTGQQYRLDFWARADSTRTIAVETEDAQGHLTGLYGQVSLNTSWKAFSISFTAALSDRSDLLTFAMGDSMGQIWLDKIQLTQVIPAIHRRDFTNGVVLLNGTSATQTITLESAFQRFTGTQAPRYQYIIDDAAQNFSTQGSWTQVTYDSGLPLGVFNLSPPFYHCWQSTCHQLDASSGTSQWNLNIPEDGTYSIQAWLPAAPKAATWTKNAVYEVVSGGVVVASMTLDQTSAAAGDAWHPLATVYLTVAGAPFVRLHNRGTGSLIADALYVTSAALYNDGSPAPQVTLAPLDGILLQRQQPVSAPLSRVNSVANAASFQPAIASGGFVSIVEPGSAIRRAAGPPRISQAGICLFRWTEAR